MKVRVEYDPAPIRHIAVQCPNCKKWFNGRDIIDGDWMSDLRESWQIRWATFICPICEEEFSGVQSTEGLNIEVASYPEVYRECLNKKVTWE